MKVVSEFSPRIEGPGRCRMCFHHVESQGHHKECVPRLDAQMDNARQIALQCNGSPAQVNHYLVHGPVPWMTCRPVVDLVDDIEAHKKVVAAILDGASAHWFNWIEPETPESVAYNNAALDRLKVIKERREWRRKHDESHWVEVKLDNDDDDGDDLF